MHEATKLITAQRGVIVMAKVKNYKGRDVPDGSTYYWDGVFYNFTGTSPTCCGARGKTVTYSAHSEGYIKKIGEELPEVGSIIEPDWINGFPPIGCECWMMDENNQWVDVEIIASHKGFVHGWSDSREQVYFSNQSDEFQKVKSEKEIEKEAFADWARSLLNGMDGTIEEHHGMEQAISIISDSLDSMPKGDK